MHTIVSQAADIQLTTVERVMEQGEILDPSESVFVYRCVEYATALIEQYCNRRFAWRELTQRVTCHGGYELLLAHRPIVSVSEITRDGAEVDISELLVTEPDVGIIQNVTPFANTGVPEGFIVYQPSPFIRAPEYAVTYVGGYACFPAYDPPVSGTYEGEGEPGPGDPGFPGATAEAEEAPEGVATLPEDVAAIATDLALIRYDDRRRNLLRTSESENGARADYRTMKDLLDERAYLWRWTS